MEATPTLERGFTMTALFPVGTTVRVTDEMLDYLSDEGPSAERTYALGYVDEVAESVNVLHTGTVVLYAVRWYTGDRRPGVRHIFRESELQTAKMPPREQTPHTVYMDASPDSTVHDEPAAFYTGQGE
jgi:hypothetical protein